MTGRLSALLFPDPPRSFRGRRAVKIALRAVHVLCAGVLVGAYLFEVDEELRIRWLLATIATGVALLALDLFESVTIALQVRGVFVLAKIAVVALLPWLPAPGWTLAVVLALSVLSSHAPSRLRYHLLLGRGRIRPSETKG